MVLPEVHRFLKGETVSAAQVQRTAAKYIVDPNNKVVKDQYGWDGFIDSFDNAPAGSIAVIEVNGVMFKEDQACGPVGMVSLMNQMNQAKSNSNIAGIILSMDTPGGQVNGTYDFSTLVKNAGKPTVCFITGHCCSAGYWVGSSASHIIASNELAEIGSIGVMCNLVDDSAALEKEGYKVITIRATNSTLKNESYYQALQGNHEPIIAQLDHINKYFSKTVNKNRKGKLGTDPRIMQGEVFFAKEAISLGMIDAIGTMDDAISYIKNNSKTTKMSKQNTATQRTHLNATLGITENHASTDEGVFMQDSELDTIEASLANAATLQAENTRLTAENATLSNNEALQTANQTISTQANRIQELEAKVATLEGAPATKGTRTTATADPAKETKSPYVDDGSAAFAERYGLS